MDIPRLETGRLVLDAFTGADVPELVRLAGAREIADTTLSIPHPYQAADAERFLEYQQAAAARGEELVLAIRARQGGRLAGCIALREIDRTHLQAELGYWVGVPYWGKGFATEASRALVAYGFDKLGLNRIYAHHMTRNPPSGRVLERIGMRHEGVLRERVLKWGRFEDVAIYAVLRSDAPG